MQGTEMKKYILPLVNSGIICSLSIALNFRDGTPVAGVFFAVLMLIPTLYVINQIKNNGNEIKIKAINKMMTLLSATLLGGTLYEMITENRISDAVGDRMAIVLVIIGGIILVVDYYIKPIMGKR